MREGSYTCDKLKVELEEVKGREELPVMIMNSGFETDEHPKADALRQFMQECRYEREYSCGQFNVFLPQ